jgi:addiction module HigA family antidote
MRNVPYPTPGEIVLKEFLAPMGIKPHRLAKDISVPEIRNSETLAGGRSVAVGTELRLSGYFGVNDGFRTGLQLDYDAARVKDELSAALARITPLELAA